MYSILHHEISLFIFQTVDKSSYNKEKIAQIAHNTTLPSPSPVMNSISLQLRNIYTIKQFSNFAKRYKNTQKEKNKYVARYSAIASSILGKSTSKPYHTSLNFSIFKLMAPPIYIDYMRLIQLEQIENHFDQNQAVEGIKKFCLKTTLKCVITFFHYFI